MALVCEEETYRIIGACFAVFNEKGCGFVKSVYQECLEIELEEQGIPFQAQELFDLTYRGRLLKSKYKADLVVFGNVLVELKAVSALVDEHRAQVLNYLAASGLKVGLLVNFGSHKGLVYERLLPRAAS